MGEKSGKSKPKTEKIFISFLERGASKTPKKYLLLHISISSSLAMTKNVFSQSVFLIFLNLL